MIHLGKKKKLYPTGWCGISLRGGEKRVSWALCSYFWVLFSTAKRAPDCPIIQQITFIEYLKRALSYLVSVGEGRGGRGGELFHTSDFCEWLLDRGRDYGGEGRVMAYEFG